MVCPPVQAVSGEEIGRLVTRLERYGLQTAQVRCFLLLLQQGVNDSEHWVFASDEDTAEAPVTLVITLPLPGLLVMDAFCADSPAGHDRLLAALLCEPVSRLLWRPDRRLRADSWPLRLRPALERAAGRRGYTVTPVSAGACLFVREADGAPDTEVARISAPGDVEVRPLSMCHLERVQQHWPYLRHVPDAAAILRRSVQTGLSAGVFVRRRPAPDGPAEPQPVSWILLNTAGKLGFAHTLETQRRRGLARLALAELTRRCQARHLPAVVATGRDNLGMLGAMRPLGFTAVHDVFWAVVAPPTPTPTDEAPQTADVTDSIGEPGS